MTKQASREEVLRIEIKQLIARYTDKLGTKKANAVIDAIVKYIVTMENINNLPLYPPSFQMSEHDPIHEWFELSYAQFLTIPRLVLQSMPIEWQTRMAGLLWIMDETFDWRPEGGRYWVKLKDDQGKYADAPLNDYRRGNIEHLRIKRG